MASRKKKQCDCIDKVNKALAPHNGELDLVYQLFKGRSLTQIATMPVKTGRGTKKPPLLTATYCPFCGEKYPD